MPDQRTFELPTEQTTWDTDMWFLVDKSAWSVARKLDPELLDNRFQAQGDVLDDLNTLGPSTVDGEFLVATGAGALAWESGATARDSIGLGTGDGPTFDALTIDGASTLTIVRAGVPSRSMVLDYSTSTFDFAVGAGDPIRFLVGGVQLWNFTSDANVYVNRDNTDMDLIMDGDTNDNFIVFDGGQERVRIGGASPDAKLHVAGTADEPQLIVEDNATQTADRLQIKTSAGAIDLAVEPDGALNWIADISTDTAPTDDTTLKRLSLQKLASAPTNAAYIAFSNNPGADTFYLVMEEA